jgi:hypothetical protein
VGGCVGGGGGGWGGGGGGGGGGGRLLLPPTSVLGPVSSFYCRPCCSVMGPATDPAEGVRKGPMLL